MTPRLTGRSHLTSPGKEVLTAGSHQVRKYQQPQGTYLRAGDQVTASLEAQNRLRPLWPKARVRVSPQGTATGDTSVKDGVLSIDPLLVTPPDAGSCSEAPSRTRKHGPLVTRNPKSTKTLRRLRERQRGRNTCLGQRGQDKSLLSSPVGREPRGLPAHPALAKMGKCLGVHSGHLPRLKPQWRKRSSFCTCVSKFPSSFTPKKPSPVTTYLGLTRVFSLVYPSLLVALKKTSCLGAFP